MTHLGKIEFEHRHKHIGSETCTVGEIDCSFINMSAEIKRDGKSSTPLPSPAPLSISTTAAEAANNADGSHSKVDLSESDGLERMTVVPDEVVPRREIETSKISNETDDDGEYMPKSFLSSSSSSSSSSSTAKNNKPSKFSAAWTDFLVTFRKPISKLVCWMSDSAARHPRMTIAVGIVSAFVLAISGVLTNFYLEVDGDVLWTPTPSRVLAHGDWLSRSDGFPSPPRVSLFTVHADGANVLADDENRIGEGIRRVFAALETVSTTAGYDDVCEDATVSMLNENGQTTCFISSVARYFGYSLGAFNATVANGSDDLLSILSQPNYPDGTPAEIKSIFGNARFDSATNLLTSADAFVFSVAFPDNDAAFDFEDAILDNVLALREQWANEAGNIYRLEIFTQRSFDDEFERAIVADIPLVPMIFVVMSIFTGFVFFRKNWIHSRCLLGFGAVCSVFLSIMVGYGILFIVGVPFTSMTQVVPFIMFGIGLDDAFIIMGAYQRMDRSIPVLDRVHDTMEEVGVSLFVTTFTSVVAFALGSLSAIPAVDWLCYYAAPTIFIDFIFQVTFFVALIVLDERRVEEQKRDCFVCLKAPKLLLPDGQEEEEVPEGTIADSFMVWYSDILLKPSVKVIVLAIFFGMFGGLTYSATLLKQEFYFADVLPSDSYVGDFWENYNDITGSSGIAPYIVFRDIDQGDTDIQAQMEVYVNNIVAMDEVGGQQPEFFWVRDFQSFLRSQTSMSALANTFPKDSAAHDTYRVSSSTVAEAMAGLSFERQLDVFLTVPTYSQLYSNNIVRNSEGNVTASRTRVRMSNIDNRSVDEQVDALEEQRLISEETSINGDVDPENWKFFTFEQLYYIWQFYTESPTELLLTTILGVSAVSIISLVFIPHWSSVLFVAPIMSVLYVDLLGFLQLCGVSINAVSYISLAMSIGLMVDFLLHILLRFFESKETNRNAKVKDALRTIGSSVLIGGISTFLGILPLVFSTSTVFNTIFYCFLGLVILGISHGLIFLPVVLSLLGPTVVLELQ